MEPLEITMTVFFSITVLIVAYYFVERPRIVSIKPVSAGIPSSEDLVKDLVIGELCEEDYLFYKSRGIDPNKYQFKQVRGTCMLPKGIDAGDIVLIKRFSFLENKLSSSPFFIKCKKAKVKKGDILFIDFVDDASRRRIKLREFVSWTDDGHSAVTQCYGKQGEIHLSSAPHSLKYIYGIVRFAEHWN